MNTLPMKTSLLALALLGLGACSDSDNMAPIEPPPPPQVAMQSFEVTVTNLTANQPMSPLALISHDDNVKLWQIGESASVALEQVAEAGNSSGFDSLSGVNAVVRGAGMLPPGMSETLMLTLEEDKVDALSLLTMLVNTNDGFSGINAMDIDSMEKGSAKTLTLMAYDAGTEANSEAKGSIPGPADGGEGFNAARDDVNRVHVHPGVISQDDGLTGSVLNASHRFDNPVLKVTVRRTE
ncbi:spondin domain-containing protein [Shewanella sp. JM162201]|uniref:Spondin domain-containing protein n=1 Tax=Shewanella jiangmenensis TaxID=2837387 RepID=A0ABS5V2I3_9GAMM|nr:spondin domain-containing protein [Shewanella jiangmenensis]MBT1444026.1 spondin domain-containing protein [Shewanella jiangmenensis]